MKISNKFRSVCWAGVSFGHFLLASVPSYSHRYLAFIIALLALVATKIMWNAPDAN